jgi:hypothetical protein
MNRITTLVSLASAATIWVACDSENLVGPPAVGSNVIAATYEAEWVGFREGIGSVDLLDTGESYADVPVCVETWLEGGRLHGVVYIRLLEPPDALIELSDRPRSGDHEGVCAGAWVAITAGSRTEEIKSGQTLVLYGPDGFSRGERRLLQIERWGDESDWDLRVFRLGWRASTVSPFIGYFEVASISLRLN